MIGFRARKILKIWLFLQMIKNSVSMPKHDLGGGNGGLNCRCGLKKRTFSHSRILGAVEAYANEYPWHAWLKLRSDTDYKGRGSLIAKRWVVTAAHILKNKLTNDILVVLGKHDRRSSYDITQTFSVLEKIVHADYNSITVDNDIGLLKLKSEAAYNENVTPVCLPFRLDNLDSNVTLAATGWRDLSIWGPLSDVLLTLDVNYITTSRCRSSKYGYSSRITYNMICAGDSGKGNCIYDSGGPLVYENPRNRRNFLVGIVSWGNLRCTHPYYPCVYTKVENYIDWIIDKTGAAEEVCDAASIN